MHACRGKARQADRLFAAMPCPSSSIENKLLETGQKAYILGTKQVNHPLCKASLLFEGFKSC